MRVILMDCLPNFRSLLPAAMYIFSGDVTLNISDHFPVVATLLVVT